MPFEMDRAFYARMYGPTVGDRVRLGDTNLLVEVEQDYTGYGDETLWGFGKPNRSARTCWTSMQGADSMLPGRVGHQLHLLP